MKKNVNYYLEEKIKNDFKMTAFFLNRSESQIIEELMRDFVIKNKALINEQLIKNIKNENEKN